MPTSWRSWTARRRASVGRGVHVRPDGLDELLAHRVEGIEGGERVLEDGADPAAADPAEGVLGQSVDPLAAEQDAAPRDPAGRLQQADDRGAGDGFSGTGFAHHAQDLARVDGQRDAVHGGEDSPTGGELHGQVLDLEDRGRRQSPVSATSLN